MVVVVRKHSFGEEDSVLLIKRKSENSTADCYKKLALYDIYKSSKAKLDIFYLFGKFFCFFFVFLLYL